MANARTRSMLRQVVGLGVMVLAVATYADAQSAGGRLEGTWDVALTVRNCGTAAGIVTFPEMATFGRGGTFVGSTTGVPPANKTPAQGVWYHESDRTYVYRGKFFRFDPASGAVVGWNEVWQRIELGLEGNTFTGAGGVDIYTVSTGQWTKGCSSTEAKRFE